VYASLRAFELQTYIRHGTLHCQLCQSSPLYPQSTMKPTLALVLFGLSSFVTSRPQPKSANFRNYRIKNGLNGQTKRWSNDTSSGIPSCAVPEPQTITAPKLNIWGSLTDDEAASVASYLFSQTSLNLTAAADAGEWDNSVYALIQYVED
jgi:hypothetical protein